VVTKIILSLIPIPVNWLRKCGRFLCTLDYVVEQGEQIIIDLGMSYTHIISLELSL
jgi:hypothetical protein